MRAMCFGDNDEDHLVFFYSNGEGSVLAQTTAQRYCQVSGRNTQLCKHCSSSTIDRSNDPVFFCTVTGEPDNKCAHCVVSSCFNNTEDGSESDSDPEADFDSDESDVEVQKLQQGTEEDSYTYNAVVSLLDGKRTGRQVLTALAEQHNIHRGLSWLNKFKAANGLSVKRGMSLAESSTDWIDYAKELVYKGLKATEIRYYLLSERGISIGRTALWKILKAAGVRLSEPQISTENLEALVAAETDGRPGIGYKGVTEAIRNKHMIKVARSRVHAIMRSENPTLSAGRLGNVMIRRIYGSRGANSVWHFDGYDKLARFGFGIHACTEGLSRMYTWWYVGATNRLAVVVGALFVKAVERLKVRPDLTRTDFGSENVVVAAIQCYYSMELQRNHAGHIYGDSRRNTRIEGGWRILSKDHMKFWKTLFEYLESKQQFNVNDFYEIKCAQFVFGQFISDEMDEWCKRWNSHPIRKTKESNAPSGRPFMIFEHPELWNYSQVGHPVPNDLREVAIAVSKGMPYADSMFDDTDPFMLSAYRESFKQSAMEFGCYPVTKRNMVPCFLHLRSNIALKESLGFVRE
ncbi:hypothetical protein HDU99_008806 [Rhizoclosmatium hyalinum]|nr:hypothetical protein HDU99_008806 [Rhizoclosmatium hyalinum]